MATRSETIQNGLSNWRAEIRFSKDMPETFRCVNDETLGELKDISKLVGDSVQAKPELRLVRMKKPGVLGKILGLNEYPCWESKGWVVDNNCVQDSSLVMSQDGSLYIGELGSDEQGLPTLSVDGQTGWSITGYVNHVRNGSDKLEAENRLAHDLAAISASLRLFTEEKIFQTSPVF